MAALQEAEHTTFPAPLCAHTQELKGPQASLNNETGKQD